MYVGILNTKLSEVFYGEVFANASEAWESVIDLHGYRALPCSKATVYVREVLNVCDKSMILEPTRELCQDLHVLGETVMYGKF